MRFYHKFSPRFLQCCKIQWSSLGCFWTKFLMFHFPHHVIIFQKMYWGKNLIATVKLKFLLKFCYLPSPLSCKLFILFAWKTLYKYVHYFSCTYLCYLVMFAAFKLICYIIYRKAMLYAFYIEGLWLLSDHLVLLHWWLSVTKSNFGWSAKYTQRGGCVVDKFVQSTMFAAFYH